MSKTSLKSLKMYTLQESMAIVCIMAKLTHKVSPMESEWQSRDKCQYMKVSSGMGRSLSHIYELLV